MELPAHVQRMVEEKKDLDDKRHKLYQFQRTDVHAALEQEDKSLLEAQMQHMTWYSDILRARLERAGVNT